MRHCRDWRAFLDPKRDEDGTAGGAVFFFFFFCSISDAPTGDAHACYSALGVAPSSNGGVARMARSVMVDCVSVEAGRSECSAMRVRSRVVATSSRPAKIAARVDSSSVASQRSGARRIALTRARSRAASLSA